MRACFQVPLCIFGYLQKIEKIQKSGHSLKGYFPAEYKRFRGPNKWLNPITMKKRIGLSAGSFILIYNVKQR
jgi:hypothetical protein